MSDIYQSQAAINRIHTNLNNFIYWKWVLRCCSFWLCLMPACICYIYARFLCGIPHEIASCPVHITWVSFSICLVVPLLIRESILHLYLDKKWQSEIKPLADFWNQRMLQDGIPVSLNCGFYWSFPFLLEHCIQRYVYWLHIEYLNTDDTPSVNMGEQLGSSTLQEEQQTLNIVLDRQEERQAEHSVLVKKQPDMIFDHQLPHPCSVTRNKIFNVAAIEKRHIRIAFVDTNPDKIHDDFVSYAALPQLQHPNTNNCNQQEENTKNEFVIQHPLEKNDTTLRIHHPLKKNGETLRVQHPLQDIAKAPLMGHPLSPTG